MAEVLGVVASGITVVDTAVKIGSGIIKLKRLWNEVKDVPDTIKSLMQRLELLAVMMEEMEATHQSNTENATLRPFNSQGMQLSMMQCREAMDALEDLVTKLTKHVDSQKRLKRAKAKLKVALGKDDLNQCQGRLSDVVQLLQLAQSCYQTSLNGAMLQRIIALPTHLENQLQVKVMAIGSSAAQSELEPGKIEINSLTAEEIGNGDTRPSANLGQKPSCMRSWYNVRRSLGPFASYTWDSSETKDYESGFIQKDLRFRFELAQWLSGRSWEIQVSRAMSGWHHYLKTYNIVPYDSEVIQCAVTADLDRIKYLFANNLASIHDRDVEGNSLLWYTVLPGITWNEDNIQSAFELAKFLHTCGLDITERRDNSYSPLLICSSNAVWEKYCPWIFTFWQSSAAANNLDVADTLKVLEKPQFTTYPAFAAFQPTIQPDFYKMRLIDRVTTWLEHDIVDPRLFRKIVRETGPITRSDAVELAEWDVNLLSLAAISFARNRLRYGYNPSRWNQFMHELVNTIGDINLEQEEYCHYEIKGFRSGLESGNPLMACIRTAEYTFFQAREKSRKRSFETHLRTEIIKWLQILQDCNIALEDYGQHEYTMIFGGNWKRRWLGYKTTAWIWTGFSWGPNPSDWVFHIDRVVERFSGDFWRLIDNPIQQVPGAWIDNDSKVWDYHDLFPDDSESELEDDSEDDSDHE